MKTAQVTTREESKVTSAYRGLTACFSKAVKESTYGVWSLSPTVGYSCVAAAIDA